MRMKKTEASYVMGSERVRPIDKQGAMLQISQEHGRNSEAREEWEGHSDPLEHRDTVGSINRRDWPAGVWLSNRTHAHHVWSWFITSTTEQTKEAKKEEEVLEKNRAFAGSKHRKLQAWDLGWSSAPAADCALWPGGKPQASLQDGKGRLHHEHLSVDLLCPKNFKP